GFDLPALYRDIDALDNRVDGQVQLDLYQAVGRLIFVTSGWFLRNDTGSGAVDERIAELVEARKALEPKLGSLLPAFNKAALEERRQGFIAAGAPEGLAMRLALTDVAELIPDI